MFQKLTLFLKEHQEEIVLLVGVILISLLSFAAGYIIAKNEAKEPIRIELEKPGVGAETAFLSRRGDGGTRRFPCVGKQPDRQVQGVRN